MVTQIGGQPTVRRRFAAVSNDLHTPGYWCVQQYNRVVAGSTLVTGTMYMVAFNVDQRTSYDEIVVRTNSTHSSTDSACFLSVWTHDPVNIRPLTQVAVSTEIGLVAASTAYTASVAFTLEPGIYWAVIYCEVGTNVWNLVSESDHGITTVPIGIPFPSSTSTTNDRVIASLARAWDDTMPSTFPAGALTWGLALMFPSFMMRVV